MTGRTRFFVLGAVLVLSIGLCTGLVAYYNTGMLTASAPAGQAELTYVPQDSAAVAYANVAEVMKSDVRKRIQQALPTGEDKQKLLDETGIDVEKDIDSVVAGFNTDGKQDGVVVLIRGRFDAAKIESLAQSHGAVPEDYKGKHLLVGHETPNGHDTMAHDPAARHADATHAAHMEALHSTAALGFVEPGLLALGDPDAIKRAIDVHVSGENVTKNNDLMKIINDLKSGNNAWIAGRFDAVSNHVGMPQAAKDQLATVQLFAIGAHLNGGVKGTLRAEARDDKAAEDLRAIVNGALAAGRLVSSNQQNKTLETAINTMQMSGTGKTVAVTFSVPPEFLDMLNGLAGLKNLSKPAVIKK
jgi:hypothetical protein